MIQEKAPVMMCPWCDSRVPMLFVTTRLWDKHEGIGVLRGFYDCRSCGKISPLIKVEYDTGILTIDPDYPLRAIFQDAHKYITEWADKIRKERGEETW